MQTFAIFLACLAAIALLGWINSKITGAHSYYLDEWKLDDGETELWRDDAADVWVVPHAPRALLKSFLRFHRWSVIVTGKRIVTAVKSITGRKVVQHTIYFGTTTDAKSEEVGGGALNRGYTTFVISRMEPHVEDKSPHIDLIIKKGLGSSFNIELIKIFTDKGADFRLP